MSRARGIVSLLLSGLLLSGCSHGASEARQPTAPAPTPTDLPAAQVRRIESDLVSGKVRRLRRSVELPAGVMLDRRLLADLDHLSITFDLSTAIVIGENQVQVTAEVTSDDGAHRQWAVILDHVGNRYVVAGTRPVKP